MAQSYPELYLMAIQFWDSTIQSRQNIIPNYFAEIACFTVLLYIRDNLTFGITNLVSSEKRSIIFVGGVIMDYITTKEAATNWGISDRRVLQYCNDDRIEGVIKIGNMWLIPKTAKKPIDGRTKQGKEQKYE